MIEQPFAIPEHFVPLSHPSVPAGPAWWFICRGSELLVAPLSAPGEDLSQNQNHNGEAAAYAIPQATTLEALGMKPVRLQTLGYLANQPCVAAELVEDSAHPEHLSYINLRSLYGSLQEAFFAIAARAIQIIEWDRTHQYCGHCATPLRQIPGERAKHCPKCSLRQYPRLSPAVIMLITKGEQLLLARAPRFRNGMYSVLAGFVEPGESLEETVAREVKEEVGIEIQNIRYFGSQPWPFPNSLMIGFTADYARGTLIPAPDEIEAAAWFDKHNLPPVPGKLSIARKLIDWFLEQPSHTVQ